MPNEIPPGDEGMEIPPEILMPALITAAMTIRYLVEVPKAYDDWVAWQRKDLGFPVKPPKRDSMTMLFEIMVGLAAANSTPEQVALITALGKGMGPN